MPNPYLGRIFVKIFKLKAKKFIVLAVLFLLPLFVYMFFATGVNNFVKLPTLTYGVDELQQFESDGGSTLQFKERITVLGFFGSDIEGKKANAFNLAHKIYKKNYQFDEFQFVILATPDQKDLALQLKEQLKEIEDPVNWKFAFGNESDIREVFESLGTTYVLDENLASDYVFIVDKEGNLRGRNDDEDEGTLYGFNASDYAEVNNKMSDDVKVVLAEYRLALKKYKADREI